MSAWFLDSELSTCLHNIVFYVYLLWLTLDFIISGSAPITNGMATVTISGLECGVLYSITAGGMLNNGTLVGSRSSTGITIQSNSNNTRTRSK